jgi:GAF domain-containing protein
VFDAIVNIGIRLADADLGALRLFDDSRDWIQTVAIIQWEADWSGGRGLPSSEELQQFVGRKRQVLPGMQVAVVMAGKTINSSYPDIDSYERAWPIEGAVLRAGGVVADAMYWPRAHLHLPLMREGQAIGELSFTVLGARGPFSQPIVDVMQTFARQAVIAMENARLFRDAVLLR